MERKILFKAKRLDNKGWAIGDLLHSYENGAIIVPVEGGGAFSVDPSTVCQFTGLKDDNGKEIWEGDILFRDGNPQIKEEVKFHKGSFCLACMPLESLIYYPFDVVQNFVSLGSKFDRKEAKE